MTYSKVYKCIITILQVVELLGSLTLGGEGELVHFSGIFLYGDPGRTGPASAPLS